MLDLPLTALRTHKGSQEQETFKFIQLSNISKHLKRVNSGDLHQYHALLQIVYEDKYQVS